MALENARLHREVAENASRFTALANRIPQLAWMCKPDGEFFWYNDRWYEYTGTDGSQLGWGWQSVLDPKELPRVVEKWKAALATRRILGRHISAPSPRRHFSLAPVPCQTISR